MKIWSVLGFSEIGWRERRCSLRRHLCIISVLGSGGLGLGWVILSFTLVIFDLARCWDIGIGIGIRLNYEIGI